MTRKGTPRPGNGGARQGAGRKPTTKPLKMVILDPDTARMLAEMTIIARNRYQSPHMSQADLVEAIIRNKYIDWLNMEWLRNRESTSSPQVGGEK